MLKYLAAIGILLIQETVLQNGLMAEAHAGLFDPVFITLFFVAATAFDIWIGYRTGQLVQRHYPHGTFVRTGKELSTRFNESFGRLGRSSAILIAGYFNFPYVNGFAAAWLEEPFWQTFILIFIGDMLEYATLWLLVIGVAGFTPNIYYEVPIVAVIWFLLVFLLNWARKKM